MKANTKHVDFSLDGDFKQKLLTEIKDKYFNVLSDDDLCRVSAAGDIVETQKSGIKPFSDGKDD